MTEIDDATRVALAMLPTGGAVITSADLEEKATAVATMLKGTHGEVDREELIRHLESLITIWQEGSISLVDTKDHEEWLPNSKADIAWNYWDRYQRYMEDVALLPPQVVWRTDEVTDSILSKLENPKRKGTWDRRGLVVGQVQSGKTSNYTALISKAADSGFKLILVLAGVHNSLRAQTQLRLDEGFLGFDTQYLHRLDDSGSHLVGVGTLPGFPTLHTASLTTSSERGDFNTKVATNLLLPLGDYPVLLVVKKHAGVLKNIHDWVAQMHGVSVPGSNDKKKTISSIPLLLIDDEADNASIDTSKDDPGIDPSAINRGIRKILALFEQSAYVGYTATPFANLYSEAFEKHDDYSKDLFPSSFIESLRPPSSYFGPERVFGIGDDHPEPLPIHHHAEDAHAWIPPKHDKYWKPSSKLPDSLSGAIGAFLLSSAARRARGQTKVHNSMLIHVTRFQLVQEEVADLVKQHVHKLKRRLRYDGPQEAPISSGLSALKRQWEMEFETATEHFAPEEAERISWDELEPHIRPALEKIEIRVINGAAKDALEYYENAENGLSVIAIGGDKLSRGLTLEGLTVSYYLRASKMYDTLMQMGRWFGYRPGYEDLCRLYTTEELRTWYREITVATEELRRDLEEMAALGATPQEYGLRVRKSPSGLAVTAANRMRGAQTIRLSFSGYSSETVLFRTSERAMMNNDVALRNLLEALGGKETSVAINAENRIWTGVNGGLICDHLLDHYESDPMAWRVRPNLIADYIRKCVGEDELTDFTVALISNSNAQTEVPIAGMKVGLTERAMLGAEDDKERADLLRLRNDERYSIRRLLNPVDEKIGLTESQMELALRRTIASYEEDPGTRKSKPKSPGGSQIRGVRHPTTGLLLLYLLDNSKYSEFVATPLVGFGFSFPVSEHAIEVEYAANKVWTHQQLVEAGLDE